MEGRAMDAIADVSTADVIARFNRAFLDHDPAALTGLIAENCVIENTTPAPNGDRRVGRAACLETWQGLATAPGTQFELEEVAVWGARAIVRWRFRWGEGDENSVRGVNLMRVRDGRIVEAMGYVKGA
jgi:ketosteroid isomerase-like protein